MVQPRTVVAITLSTVATGLLTYAVYFDYRRRNDPGFRKQLRRNIKKQERAVKEEAETQVVRQRQAIKAAVEMAKAEGFPTDVGEKEAYFMEQVARGEGFGTSGINHKRLLFKNADIVGTENVGAALCFYKALKVYPTPSDLISIYDRTVPKAVLDILAEMIAADSSLNVGTFATGLDIERGLD
ncbi:hypothetical protein EPUL_000627 [Erysiphe pulchra]|uniref:Mitochondrial import receptor subunit tom-20 n=1 Tax=Erysiphe pulchra TaxID=225359 RepID=A0A2S4PZ23_9PEZI|nr:hypothetical protein EPUL_000627 [Erysiphe pulchra]